MNGFARASEVALKWIKISGAILLLLLTLYFLLMPNFVRSGTSKANGCINNLRQIDGAKCQLVYEQKKGIGEAIAREDIRPYLRIKGTLTCPLGGRYDLGLTATNPPTCSIPGHVLPP